MEPLLLVYLLFVHWFADFVLQTEEMAEKKSEPYNFALLEHCFIYGACFIVATLNPLYGLALGFIHFPVDYYTSRVNKQLYNDNKIHRFFVSIGFDQFLHMATIILLGAKLL